MKKFVKLLVLTLSVSSLFCYRVYSQSIAQQTFLPSPNTASLGIFGEFPQSSANGVPSINIPLYDINFKGISIPLKLRYNSNLVKPDQHPGWVGLGWDLTAGGSISRIVNDLEDELNYNDPRPEYSYIYSKGYYYSYDFFSAPDWDSPTKVQEISNKRWGLQALDSQPDEFVFSFLSYHGTFYLDETRNWKVRSDAKLKVINSNIFEKFTLIDASGNQFIFGESEVDCEYSASLFAYQSSGGFKRKTWNLSKIVTATGDIVQFIYERGSTLINPQPYWHFAYPSPNNTTTEVNRMTGSQVKPSYLKKIVTPTEEIAFARIRSTEMTYRYEEFERDIYYSAIESNLGNYIELWNEERKSVDYAYYFSDTDVLLKGIQFQQLNSIQCKNLLDGTIHKQFSFQFSNSTSERLKLKAITDLSGKTYEFYYTSDFDSSLKLPQYCAGTNDFWGYFNGRSQDYSTQASYLFSKEPSTLKLQCELLKRIVYPTKGYSDFEFEPHSYSKEVATIRYDPLILLPSDKIGGGVRIKKIENRDSDGQLIDTRSYFYSSDYSISGSVGPSSGIMGGQYFFYYIPPPQSGAAKGAGDMFSRNPLILNSNGCTVVSPRQTTSCGVASLLVG